MSQAHSEQGMVYEGGDSPARSALGCSEPTQSSVIGLVLEHGGSCHMKGLERLCDLEWLKTLKHTWPGEEDWGSGDMSGITVTRFN